MISVKTSFRHHRNEELHPPHDDSRRRERSIYSIPMIMKTSRYALAYSFLLFLCHLDWIQCFLSPPNRPTTRTRTTRAAAADASSSSSSALTREEIARYSRHLVLPDVGVKGQQALKDASVLVIGAGGLGSPCLLYLAAAGVGHVGIVDADVVDESNLQRQVIHGTSTVGVSKCESAAQRMRDINPHVNVRLYQQEFTSETALDILGGGFGDDCPRYDVVVDGSDNFPTKYLIK